MKITYVLMRFYSGGGLARYKIVNCEEDNLINHLIEFEQECGRENLGERIGILEIDEFDAIKEAIRKEI